MAPRTTFPAGGPDQTLFMVLFGLGFAIAVVGYLSGSKTLRLAGILMLFFATGLFVVDVFTTPSI